MLVDSKSLSSKESWLAESNVFETSMKQMFWACLLELQPLISIAEEWKYQQASFLSAAIHPSVSNNYDVMVLRFTVLLRDLETCPLPVPIPFSLPLLRHSHSALAPPKPWSSSPQTLFLPFKLGPWLSPGQLLKLGIAVGEF